jgi:NADH:ubiquinone oxidoreductase subunit 5 (subunit L)/multisubunit Na+/H+ antiporter MnhA subunit
LARNLATPCLGRKPKARVATYIKYTISGNLALWLGSAYVFFTFYHSFHLLLKTFLAPTNSFKQDILQRHDAPILKAILLIFLAFGNIFV